MTSTTASGEGRRRFVDTNVLVYAFDSGAGERAEVARWILADAVPGELVISAQVLNEFYVVVTRKLAKPLELDAARAAVHELSSLAVVPLTSRLVLAGVDRSARSQLSLWDGLIVEAALDGGCEVLLTEDLNAGQRFDDLVVVNPFAPPANAA